MIDNFKLISSLLEYTEGNFFFGQIIQRRKENPDIGSENHVIKDYYFDSVKPLTHDKIIEIKKICVLFNARFYLNLTPRNYEEVSWQVFGDLAKNIQCKNWRAQKGIWTTATGRRPHKNGKVWVIDLDGEETKISEQFLLWAEQKHPLGGKLIARVPTKNGLHLIVKPFDIQGFTTAFPECDENTIQKNNPTVVFCP